MTRPKWPRQVWRSWDWHHLPMWGRQGSETGCLPPGWLTEPLPLHSPSSGHFPSTPLSAVSPHGEPDHLTLVPVLTNLYRGPNPCHPGALCDLAPPELPHARPMLIVHSCTHSFDSLMLRCRCSVWHVPSFPLPSMCPGAV